MAKVTSPQEVFDMVPGLADPETLKGVDAVVQFDLSGEGGGQWVVTVANGEVKTAQGTAENPRVSVSMAASDYVDMVNGELNPMQAFMRGKVKVKGDMAFVMKMQSLFGKGR